MQNLFEKARQAVEEDRSSENLQRLADVLADLGRNGPGVRQKIHGRNAWREEAAPLAAEALEKAEVSQHGDMCAVS